jgi:hypothetical protein
MKITSKDIKMCVRDYFSNLPSASYGIINQGVEVRLRKEKLHKQNLVKTLIFERGPYTESNAVCRFYDSKGKHVDVQECSSLADFKSILSTYYPQCDPQDDPIDTSLSTEQNLVFISNNKVEFLSATIRPDMEEDSCQINEADELVQRHTQNMLKCEKEYLIAKKRYDEACVMFVYYSKLHNTPITADN